LPTRTAGNLNLNYLLLFFIMPLHNGIG